MDQHWYTRVETWSGNNQGNFRLHRFTMSDIAKSFFRGKATFWLTLYTVIRACVLKWLNASLAHLLLLSAVTNKQRHDSSVYSAAESSRSVSRSLSLSIRQHLKETLADFYCSISIQSPVGGAWRTQYFRVARLRECWSIIYRYSKYR